MTDKEIIKALECCTTEGFTCTGCPYDSVDMSGADYDCSYYLKEDALDLINRQQSQIEILEGQNRSLISEFEIQKNNFIHLQERYDDAHKIVKRVNERFINKCKELKTAKTTAIKEFAEELKHGYFGGFNTYGIGAIHARIDAAVKEAVKEMAGADNGN